MHSSRHHTHSIMHYNKKYIETKNIICHKKFEEKSFTDNNYLKNLKIPTEPALLSNYTLIPTLSIFAYIYV